MAFSFRTWAIPAVIVIILVIVGGIALFLRTPAPKSQNIAFDPLNTTYVIEETPIKLTNGGAGQEAGSAETISTRVFGQPTLGDINGDGKEDAALIVTQSTGGTGTFYYATAAIHTDTGAIGTNAIFLGDRIAPDTIQIANGIITVNYADRAANEPFSATPSIGVSKYLVLDGDTLYDVSINDIYPLAPGISWSDKKALTIMRGEESVPKTVAGIAIASEPITDITDLSSRFLPFENYYKKKLIAAGWAEDNTLAAGGPGSAVIGYKKGNDYIILGYSSVFKNGGVNSPETCPCDITLSLFSGVQEGK